ncbi:hypothetical protein PG997_007022 [Apiospora hydei]|uniref:Uncharacterized protein n=1 Tax=Apiospora hydei TaxID=1337664 RepID=A0ABR1WQD0_9PEZI
MPLFSGICEYLPYRPPERRPHPAWNRHGFQSVVVDDGRYVECRMPLLHPDPADPHRVCGARIRNTEHDLRCHWTRQHNPNGAHARDTAKDPSRPWECAASCKQAKGSPSWTTHLSHMRRVHKFRGDSRRIRKAGGVRKAGGTIDPETNEIVLPKEASEDVPDGPMFWEDHQDGGEGPPVVQLAALSLQPKCNLSASRTSSPR